jgi:valyl-tRNA synthetase
MEKLIERIEKTFPNGFEGVGADALRFTLVYSCSDGQETRLSLQKFNEIGRRFITKLWNASRFVLLSIDNLPDKDADHEDTPPSVEDLWIDSRRSSTVRAVREALDGFDFGPVGQTLYRFVWNDYCDWYLELTKGRLQEGDPGAARQAGRVLGRTLADIFRLLHPIVPFITEELWEKLLTAMDGKDLWRGDRPSSDLLILESFPTLDDTADSGLEERFESLQRLVSRIRYIRANARLADNVKLNVSTKPLEEGLGDLLGATSSVVCRMSNLEAITHTQARPDGYVTTVDPSFELYVDLGSHVDLQAEVARIDKEMAALNKKLERITKKLMNPEFLKNAPPEVVEKERAKDTEMNEMLEKLNTLRKEYASGT